MREPMRGTIRVLTRVSATAVAVAAGTLLALGTTAALAQPEQPVINWPTEPGMAFGGASVSVMRAPSTQVWFWRDVNRDGVQDEGEPFYPLEEFDTLAVGPLHLDPSEVNDNMYVIAILDGEQSEPLNLPAITAPEGWQNGVGPDGQPVR